MKESMGQPKFENGNESEGRYLQSVEEYMLGAKGFDVLISEIEKTIPTFVADRGGIVSGVSDPVIFVSNHPRLDRSLCIPADKIQNVKGGNVFGFERFNYPLVRQLMLRKLLQRPFSTISLNNGWREAMEDCWHTIITRGGNHRLDEIMEKHVDGQSVVIYPEGKSTGKVEMLPFHTGFFHLANKFGFKKIAIGVSSPILSVHGENKLSSIEIVEVPHGDVNLQEFVEYIRGKIQSELKTFE